MKRKSEARARKIKEKKEQRLKNKSAVKADPIAVNNDNSALKTENKIEEGKLINNAA